MKKFKKIAYIMLIIIIAILSLTIYTNASKDNGENQKDKVLAEIKYLEIKLENLFNSMNNIKINDYNIVEIETSKSANNNTSQKSNENEGEKSGGQSGAQGQEGEFGTSGSKQEQSGGEQASSQSQDGSSNGSEESSQNNGSSQAESSKNNKKFEMEKNQILTSESQEINWNSIKSEIENLHDDLPAITMDLYQINNINQEDILNFSKECDNLASIVQKEEKNETLTQLIKVYDYLPKFLKGTRTR